MHCAINSISIGIPTIFLAYSRKAYGMSEYIYGNSNWVIPLKNSNEELIPKINELIHINKNLIKKSRLNLNINEDIKKLLESYFILNYKLIVV